MIDYFAAGKDLFIPVFTGAIGISIILSLICRLAFQTSLAQSFTFISAFSFLGCICGAIAGASKETIVGALLTAILGLISALLAYLFGKETPEQSKQIIPMGMIALLVSALAGLTIGGINAKRWVVSDRAYEKYKLDYQMYLDVEKRRRILELEKQYGVSSKPSP